MMGAVIDTLTGFKVIDTLTGFKVSGLRSEWRLDVCVCTHTHTHTLTWRVAS